MFINLRLNSFDCGSGSGYLFYRLAMSTTTQIQRATVTGLPVCEGAYAWPRLANLVGNLRQIEGFGGSPGKEHDATGGLPA